MINKTLSAEKKRKNLREALKQNKILQFPGAMSPLVSLLVEKLQFDGIYISGAVMANDLGLPDIGLTTMTEVGLRGKQIASTTHLPSIIDADTGFGEPMNLARTIKEFISLGLSGCHIEDQVQPKRCGHLDNKTLVDTTTMVKRVKAAADAKTDDNFLLIARTDARGPEGLAASIKRAKAYRDAGADMIFTEALQTPQEFEQFKKELDHPLLANMTEFGKSPLLTKTQLEEIGYDIIIYPVTSLRLAMKAIEGGLTEIKNTGTQEGVLEKMQTRKELYKLLKYEAYEKFDTDIYNFSL